MEGSDLFSEIRVLPHIWKKVLTTYFCSNLKQHLQNACFHMIQFFFSFPSGGGGTLGQQWLLKQFCLNHPVEHIQKPKLPKLYVRVETSTSYFIIHNQFVK